MAGWTSTLMLYFFEASSYDIGSLLIMIPVSYLGGRAGASKPRWIAAGLVVMGFGSLIWTLPHFASQPYTPQAGEGEGVEGEGLCGRAGAGTQCSTAAPTSLSSFRLVFVLGQLLHGFGAAPLITLGTTFLDESVSLRSSPLYIAVFQTWFLIGPAIGYVVGGQLLSLHTDLVADSGLSPASSLWVGAWWPGFLITFTASLLCGSFILCYPSSINRKRNTCLEPDHLTSSPGMLTELRTSFASLFTNPTWVLISVGRQVNHECIT